VPAGVGLLLGVLEALACGAWTGDDGFAGRAAAVALGYAAAGALGAALGAAFLRRRAGGRRRAWTASAGAALAALATFVLRALPLPWVGLAGIGAGAGPAGEVPLVVLPVLGAGLALLFAIDGLGGSTGGDPRARARRDPRARARRDPRARARRRITARRSTTGGPRPAPSSTVSP
jgi:hypothetical protein